MVAGSLAVSLGSGCVGGSEPEYYDETGGPVDALEQPCRFCKPDAAWLCNCLVEDVIEGELVTSPKYKTYCWSGGEREVYEVCKEYCGDQEAPFASVKHLDNCVEPQTPKCEDWTPATDVVFDPEAQQYLLDLELVSGLVSDSEPLLGCDGARFARLPEGGFVVEGAARGDLLWELGLRDRDIPVTLNGLELAGDDDALLAFVQLWLLEGDTQYTLELLREGRTTVLEYRIEGL